MGRKTPLPGVFSFGTMRLRPHVLALGLAALSASSRASAWDGVAASTGVGSARVVVWSDDEARVSADDGARFVPLALPPSKGGIVRAAITSSGAVAVARSASVKEGWASEVVVVRPDGGTRTIDLTADGGTTHGDDRVVVALDDDLVVMSDRRVSWSQDGGRTFDAASIPTSAPPLAEWYDVTRTSAGLLFVDVEIDTCGSSDVLQWQRLLQLGPRATTPTSAPLVTQPFQVSRWRFGAFGWLYATTGAGELVARGGGGVAKVVGAPAEGGLLVGHNGRTTLALRGATLMELGGGTATTLHAQAPRLEDLAVDASGRALGVDARGAVVRFSRRTGWSTVLAEEPRP